MTTTEEMLQSMLTANTGRSCLDSGSAYGRHWERNQGREFEAEAPTALNFRCYRPGEVEIEVTHNVYHWLRERLDYDEELDDLFHRWARMRDPDDREGWLNLMAEFPEMIARKYGQPGGIYGEGEPLCVNTYDEENLLSQVLQFQYWTCDDGAYVLLQIHGGCDVRGGYTSPHVFQLNGMSELAIFDYGRAAIYCTGKNRLPRAARLVEQAERQVVIPGTDPATIDTDTRGHYWTTDGGYHWYDQGSCGRGAGTQLEEYEVVDLDDLDEELDPQEWEPGILFIQEGKGYCPHCGAELAGGE